MERKSRKRLRIELEVDGAEGQIELPDRDAPIQISTSGTNIAPPKPEDAEKVRPLPTVVERPYHGGSLIWDYELGIERLLHELGQRHPCYVDVLTLYARFKENQHALSIYGPSETQSAERMRIVESANRIALATLGISCNDLCDRGV